MATTLVAVPGYREYSDTELMIELGEGNNSSLTELVRRHQRPLTGYLARIINDSEKARDLAQETFIRIFKHAAGYRPPQVGPEPAAPRLAGAPTPFSPRDGAPFATTRDEAHAARRAPLERKLLELNVQRDLLEAESRKAPPHARSYAERRRRTLREERRRDLDAAAARVKAALRDLN